MKSEGSQDRPVIVTVDNRYVRGNGEERIKTQEEKIVEVRRFDTTPAVVRRGYGLTVNLGNYESARVSVEVQVPCYVQDVEMADEFASTFCEKRIKEEIASIRGRDAAGKSPL